MFPEALAKEDMLPAFVAELLRRSNSAGFAEDTRETMAVKPWGSTHCGGNLCARSYTMVARDAFLEGNGSIRLKKIPGPLNRAYVLLRSLRAKKDRRICASIIWSGCQ